MLESLPFLLSSFLYLIHFNSTVITSLPFFLLFPQVPPCPLSNRRPVDHNCYILADIQSRLRFTRLTLEQLFTSYQALFSCAKCDSRAPHISNLSYCLRSHIPPNWASISNLHKSKDELTEVCSQGLITIKRSPQKLWQCLSCLGVPTGPLWPTKGLDVTHFFALEAFGDKSFPGGFREEEM